MSDGICYFAPPAGQLRGASHNRHPASNDDRTSGVPQGAPIVSTSYAFGTSEVRSVVPDSVPTPHEFRSDSGAGCVQPGRFVGPGAHPLRLSGA